MPSSRKHSRPPKLLEAHRAGQEGPDTGAEMPERGMEDIPYVHPDHPEYSLMRRQGHARAFLSLPQISGTGPTSSLTSDENSRSESSTSARRSNLLLKHRLAKHTRLIQAPQEGVGRGVRREIEARAGSSRLGVVEIDYDAGKASAALLLEDGPSSPSRSRRRSSIAFPTESASPSRSHGRTPLLSPRPLIPRTPAHSRSSTPILPSSQPEPLQRSKTSLELWHVGRPYSRSQLSIRALSTRSESIPLPDIDIDVLPVRSSTPPPRKPVLQQPTRVLMDLAGIDLPILGRRAGQVRRNSTTAIQETAEADDSMSNAYEELPEEEADVQEKAAEVINEDRSRDFEIYKAISEAQRSGQRDSVERLVAYYRSPREASPFAPPRETQQLCDTLPVPPGWTHMTYNMCLDAIITVRSPGDSIAPILEVYNEMLERDLVPNKMTYQHVIRALCYRERDVWAAVSQWEDEKRWGRWMAQSFGTEWDEEKSAEKDHIMEGYKAESNVDSAVKLFRAASLARGQQKYLRAVYFSIIEAVAKQPEPNLDVMMEVFRQSQRAGALGSRALYAHIFKSFGSAKNVEGLRQLWDEYEQTEKEGKGKHDREWITENIEVNLRSSTIPERRLLGFCRTAWSAAMQAFVAAGKPEIALELLDKMLASPVLVREVVPDLTIPPHPTTQTLGELVMVLAESGYIDKALDLYPRAMEIIRSFGHYATASSHFFRFTDALILAGKWREAVQLMCARNEALRAHGVEEGVGADLLRLRRLYAAVLAEARKADPAEAVQILAHVPHFTSSPDPPEKSDLAETPPSEAESSGSGLVALNPTLFTAHCDLLLKLGRYDEIAPLLDYFKVDKRPSRWFLGPIAKRITKTDVSFFELCRIWSAMELHRVSPNASAGQGLIAKYFDERNKVASALDLPLASEDWFRMLISFAGLPPTKLNDGDYDEQIIRFMDDLHEVKTKKPDSFDVFLPTKHAKIFANILIGRFGRERATQMLAGAFGESSAQTLVPVIPQESQSDASTETVSEIFSIPPTPGSLSSASEGVSESPVAAGMNLYVDPLINDWVDAHARRGTKLSARDCYTFLLHGLSRGAVALPDILSKLIVNLAREGHEPLARKVYVLAQQVLASVVPPQQQPAAWADVEDGMLMACCHLGYLEQAGMHRARIVEAGMAPSADSYATMISCSKDTTDDALVARELFDESRAMGVKPNLFLYNTIISKLSKARKAEMALELFKHMSVSGLSPSSVTYGAVIVSQAAM